MLSASQWTASNLIVGCTGKVGPMGDPGPEVSGPQGPSGVSGPSGSNGFSGSTGAIGPGGGLGPSGPPGLASFRVMTLELPSTSITYPFREDSEYNILIIKLSAPTGSSKIVMTTSPTWNPTTTYYIGDVVTYNNVYYTPRTPNTNQSPLNASYWFRFIWDPSVHYDSIGAKTTYDGLWYRLKTEFSPTSSDPPPANPADWELIPPSWMMLKNCSEYPVTLVLSPTRTYTLSPSTNNSSPVWYVYNDGASLYLY